MAQVSSMMQSFYKGVNPSDLTIFYRQFYSVVNLPLVVDATGNITPVPFVIPQGMMLDISNVTFFLTSFVGALLVHLPADYVTGSMAFQLMRNEQAPWNVATAANPAVAIPEYAGVDILETNVIEQLGLTEGHIIMNQGDRLTASYRVVRATIPVPVGGLVAFCRIGGVLFSIDTWKRVISQ